MNYGRVGEPLEGALQDIAYNPVNGIFTFYPGA
jgi:hypothetical protein